MYARKNLLKEKLMQGKMVLGTETWMRDPRIIDLIGFAGFDFVHIENEHVLSGRTSPNPPNSPDPDYNPSVRKRGGFIEIYLIK